MTPVGQIPFLTIEQEQWSYMVSLNRITSYTIYSYLLACCTCKINWRASFGVTLGTPYNLPEGLSWDDYVQFKHYIQEANLVHANQKKLEAIAEDLQKNAYEDLWVKLIMAALGICLVLWAILSQIQKIKNKAKSLCQQGGLTPSHSPSISHKYYNNYPVVT